MKPGKTYEELEIGMSHENEHLVTEQDVMDFARVSGDFNPLHVDEEYAKTTVFGTRIAHGALTASFISAILGNDLPGPGAIFTEMNMRFKRPVKIGSKVLVRAEVSEKQDRLNRVTLAVKCSVDDKIVIQGEAKVMVPSSAKK
ncbi:MaoC family dehydratase [Hirschia baltica]|uniref:MaoC domain protein dehydratase n=1 Tax=Hirschia baltica (strain ATCC 49814 / DSM 5838 / IFAM 1418) TaxID=582402 RepID=C6XQR8_HIRBI|nr:MaoC family dehydratase [Hirschia baltica]ACT58674.1 MaoC domain protein dehydratase [Hirschia baltica ATCC 49814]